MNWLHMRGRQEQLDGEGEGGSYIKSWRDERFERNDREENKRQRTKDTNCVFENVVNV